MEKRDRLHLSVLLSISVHRASFLAPLPVSLGMCSFLLSLSLPFCPAHGLPLTPAHRDLTLGVVAGVKLKQLSGIVREGVHIDSVPQHDHDPVDIIQHRDHEGEWAAKAGLILMWEPPWLHPCPL